MLSDYFPRNFPNLGSGTVDRAGACKKRSFFPFEFDTVQPTSKLEASKLVANTDEQGKCDKFP